jgi:hypothetical protein
MAMGIKGTSCSQKILRMSNEQTLVISLRRGMRNENNIEILLDWKKWHGWW